MSNAITALENALAYFEGREDADHNGRTFVANEEMNLAQELREALATAKADAEELKRLRDAQQHWRAERQEGRREALAIILRETPESFCDDYIGTHSIADTGDFGAHWNDELVRRMLDCDKFVSFGEQCEVRMYESMGSLLFSEDREFNKVVESACRDLPEGYKIEIWLENGSGTVALVSPEGNATDMHMDDSTMHDQFEKAMQIAQEASDRRTP